MHLLLDSVRLEGIHDMAALYRARGVVATSTDADTMLIRSHVAYWGGNRTADSAVIRPSRGHTYSVKDHYQPTVIVRVVDPLDHREGVTGYR